MRCIPNRCHNLSVVSAERQPLRFSDLLPPAFLFAFGWMAEIVNRSALPEFADEVPASDVALLAVTILPLAFRRRFPLTVLSIVTAAFLVTRFAEVPEFTSTSLTLFIALFAAGAYSRHRMRDWVRGAAIGVPMGTVIWGIATSQPDLPDNIALYSVFSVVINSAFFVAGWLMGDLWRKRTEDQAELARRAEMLERQADQLAEQAVASERLRIAQELHDVVAHHVSVMGCRRRPLVVPASGGLGGGALAGEHRGGRRRAVAEMGRLVGFLRSSEDRSTDPQPTTGATSSSSRCGHRAWASSCRVGRPGGWTPRRTWRPTGHTGGAQRLKHGRVPRRSWRSRTSSTSSRSGPQPRRSFRQRQRAVRGTGAAWWG